MIAALILGSTASAGGMAAVLVGPAATRGAARHQTDYALGAMALGGPADSLLRVGGEGLVSPRVVASDAYLHQRVSLRLSAVVGVGGAKGRWSADVAAGPALNLDIVNVDTRSVAAARGGLRFLSGLGWTLDKVPLHLRFQVGTAARSPARWDYDALFGVGVGW